MGRMRIKRPGLSYLYSGIAALAFSAPPLGAAVISEIHYNPPEGGQLEFVELYNPGLSALSLSGWAFISGIHFTFPAGAQIAGNGYVVLARNPQLFEERFQLWNESSSVFGPYDQGLDNGGETLALADAEGRVADEVEFDDDPPWDTGADGRGGSLERACQSGDSTLPWNWRSDPELGPSPLRPTHGAVCPAPPPPPGPVVINEIHYHPANDADLDQEFVELYNRSDTPADLTGYAFAQGIQFRFAEGTAIPPRGMLVVCRNLAVG